MYRRFLIVACLAAFVGVYSCRPSEPVARNVQEKVIHDPMGWTRRYFAELVREEEHAFALDAYEKDLDHDGIPELFVTSPSLCGNAGGLQLVFKQQKSGYRLMGEVNFYPRLLRVLPLDREGRPRFVTYWHLSCWEGNLIWITYKDGQFVRTKTEYIQPGDQGTEEGNRRYREVVLGE